MIVLDRTSFEKGIKFASDVIDNKLADIVDTNPMLLALINSVTHELKIELFKICTGKQLAWGGEEINFLKGDKK